MSTTKNILGIVPGLQATALVGENLKLIKDFNKPGKSKSPVKKMMKVGATNFIGIGMIGATAGMINDLD